MRQQLDLLNKKLEAVKQFETLFNSSEAADYTNAMGTEQQPGPFVEVLKQAGMAFDDFNFVENDKRDTLVKANLTTVRTLSNASIGPKDASAFFEHAAKSIAVKGTRDTSIKKLLEGLRELINLQKTAVEKAVNEKNMIKKNARTVGINLRYTNKGKKLVSDKKRVTLAKKVAYYAGIATLGTTGVSATTASALMQFSPQFAMLVGVHLPVAALASIAVAGVVMTAVAAYLAYRAYKPAQTVVVTPAATDTSVESTPVVDTTTDAAPVVTNPNRAAMLNYALIGSGAGLMAFAGAMQFSPKLALMLGVNLSPAALAGIAAVGLLLLSVALYRMCRAQTPAPEAVDTADVAPVPTCKDRLTQYATSGRDYANSWREYFFKKPAQSTANTDETADKTEDTGVDNKLTV